MDFTAYLKLTSFVCAVFGPVVVVMVILCQLVIKLRINNIIDPLLCVVHTYCRFF